ncbi:MAG: 50S ribosomal protein L14e [Nitrososphaerota archaeon]|nr:50S ribosomal protein L14e [Candidatus Calditenuaceae archaeon]MDW8072880.1 50S ribosomal protein L14e [Nitrososphaerota archaeon]
MVDQVGRVVVKTAGRDAGLKGVVVNILGGNKVLVTGPPSLNGLRRRAVNIMHLLPTAYRVEVGRDASDEEVMRAIENSGLKDFMKRRAEVKRW